MADEQSRPPFNRASPIPKGFGWDVVVKLDGDDLETHYRHTLEELGKRPGLIGVIFRKAQNKIQDPAKLRRLIADLIDKDSPARRPPLFPSAASMVVARHRREGRRLRRAPAKGRRGRERRRGPIVSRLSARPASWLRVCRMRFRAGSHPAPAHLGDRGGDAAAARRGDLRSGVCTGGFLLAAHDFVRKHHKLDTATRGSAPHWRGAILQSPPQSGITRSFVSSTPRNSAAWSWWTAWRGSAR